MGTHLYVCQNGNGSFVVATPGKPPAWVTCPVTSGHECERCDGAELFGDAPDFRDGVEVRYACGGGHEIALRVPEGAGKPESAQCTECDGMMLPR